MASYLDLAAQQIGLNEGDKKAALTEYLRNGGQNLDPATTAWCAAFVDSTLKQSGMQGTGKLNARSYLDWGQEVNQPQAGDVAVFSRGDPNGWQGHVGFFKGYDENGNILVLGGNQGDAVSVAAYSPDRLLGFRRAEGQQTQSGAYPQQTPPFAPSEPENRLAVRPEREEAPEMRNYLDPRAFMVAQAPVNRLKFT